jgi:hypothetical protein
MASRYFDFTRSSEGGGMISSTSLPTTAATGRPVVSVKRSLTAEKR